MTDDKKIDIYNPEKEFKPVADMLARTFHGGRLLTAVHNQWLMQKVSRYISGVMECEGLTQKEAIDLIFSDEEGEAYKGYSAIVEIAELRMDGDYASARLLAEKYEKEAREEAARIHQMRREAKAEAKRVRNAERQAKRDARMQRRKRRKPRKS